MKERFSMLDEKLVELLNDQVNKEFYSAYLYLSMANYYNEEGLSGFGNWFTIQAQEERDHAMLFLEYLQNNGAHVELKTVEAPKKQFKEFKDPLNESLKHERYVTASIHNIYAAASNVIYVRQRIGIQNLLCTNINTVINKHRNTVLVYFYSK